MHDGPRRRVRRLTYDSELSGWAGYSGNQWKHFRRSGNRQCVFGCERYYIFFGRGVRGAFGASVPFDFTAASTGAGAPMASGVNAIADVQVFWSGGQFTACAGSGPSAASCKGQGTSFSGTQTGFGTVGVLSDYEVIVTGNAGLGSGQYSTTLDPKIIVDPSFPDANAYSIVFSPNVGGSAVPPSPNPPPGR